MNRRTRPAWVHALWALPLFFLTACWNGDGVTSPPGGFEILVRSNIPTTSPGNTATLVVLARNGTTERVEWGAGSSGCQLNAYVLYWGVEWSTLRGRVCTADISPHALNPGQEREEEWTFDGFVRREGQITRLPPGRYAIYGAAGARRGEKPLYIDVRN